MKIKPLAILQMHCKGDLIPLFIGEGTKPLLQTQLWLAVVFAVPEAVVGVLGAEFGGQLAEHKTLTVERA